MDDKMDVDLQGILKKRINNIDDQYFQNTPSKKAMKRVRIELPVSDKEDDEESPEITSPKKRRGLNNQNETALPSILLNNSGISINSHNQHQLLSQSNNNDEYNKKNRILITPRSSLISQKLKSMKYNANRHNNNNNNNINNNTSNNNFLFRNITNSQAENSDTKVNDSKFYSNPATPLSIDFFSNDESSGFKSSLSASLSPPTEINSPITPTTTFSSSLPTSFTFHSPYISNNNSFSSFANKNNNNGFCFNYLSNNILGSSNKILESSEESGKDTDSSNDQENYSTSSSFKEDEENENNNNDDIDEDDDDFETEGEKHSLLSQIAKQSFEAEKKRYLLHHKNK